MLDRQDIIKGIREMADFFEQHLDFCPSYFAETNVALSTKEAIIKAAQEIGPAKKKFDQNYISLNKTFSGGVSVCLFVNRSQVCTKQVTKVILPAEPEKIIPAQPEREVEKITWDCPSSLLALAEDQTEQENA